MPRIGYEFWLNSAVLVGCWVFCILVAFLLSGHAYILGVIAGMEVQCWSWRRRQVFVSRHSRNKTKKAGLHDGDPSLGYCLFRIEEAENSEIISCFCENFRTGELPIFTSEDCWIIYSGDQRKNIPQV